MKIDLNYYQEDLAAIVATSKEAASCLECTAEQGQGTACISGERWCGLAYLLDEW
jgi:hypothetical protein